MHQNFHIFYLPATHASFLKAISIFASIAHVCQHEKSCWPRFGLFLGGSADGVQQISKGLQNTSLQHVPILIVADVNKVIILFECEKLALGHLHIIIQQTPLNWDSVKGDILLNATS